MECIISYAKELFANVFLLFFINMNSRQKQVLILYPAIFINFIFALCAMCQFLFDNRPGVEVAVLQTAL